MIKHQESDHPVKVLCEVCGIGQSSYYRWKEQQGKTAREREDAQLSAQIRTSWEKSRRNYGRPRILTDLRNHGILTSGKRVGRLMKQEGIEGRYNRRKRPLVTDSRHGKRISENKLRDAPFPTGSRQVIVTDTTYVWTDQGWHYLATVMDLFSREIIGWSFSSNNDRYLVCQALWNAASELTGSEEIIHHSDRGSTYCSDKYRNLMRTLGLESSMSAKGYCYDNAHMESFFGSLKSECQTLKKRLSPEKIRLALFDYIEGFYNTHRIHTALQGKSPREFAKNAVAAAAGGLSTSPSPTRYNPILDGDSITHQRSQQHPCGMSGIESNIDRLPQT